MIKETVKNLFTKNLGTKFLSLLIAVLLWVYVVGVLNPKIDLKFEGVDIALQGSENMKNQYGLIVTNISDPEMSVSLQGERNKLLTLKSSDILAFVDLSAITKKGTFKLPVVVEIPEGKGMLSHRSVTSTNITIDKIAKAEIPVKAVVKGHVIDGYSMGEAQITPNQITVSGPESVVLRVAYATCTVAREVISETIKADVGFALFDEKGEQVISNWLEISPQKASMVVPIEGYKTVPVTVNLVDSTGSLKGDAQIVISPSTLKLSGNRDELDKISSIEIGSVNLTSVTGSAKYTFPVVLPSGLREINGVSEVEVNVTLNTAQIKALRADNITIINVGDGQKASAVTQYLDIAYSGGEQGPEDVRILLDLKNEKFTPGKYTLPVIIEMSGENKPIGNYYITVEIK